MALSDHEQQLLEQLEQQLRSEDPSFAQNISRPVEEAPALRLSPRRLVLGIVILVVGLAAAIASLFFFDMPLAAVGGVIGFAAMVFGGYYAVTLDENAAASSAGTGSAPRSSRAPKSRSSFMERMEERWDKRQEG